MSNFVIRCTVTELDAFRSWRDDEEATIADLLVRLTGRYEPTENMLAGRALHTALELAGDGEVDALEADGYTFIPDDDVVLHLSPIREVRVERVYEVPLCADVHVRGRVDEINGTEVVDHKTTESPDLERLMNTYQWRIYLDMLEARSFRWNVFQIGRKAKDPEKTYRIRSLQTLVQYAYPEMADDIRLLCRGFAEIVMDHLPERVSIKE